MPDSLQTHPTWVTMPHSIAADETVRVYVWTSAGKTGPLASRLSRSVKVIGTDTDQSGSIDNY